MIVDFRLSNWIEHADSLEKLASVQVKQLVPYAMLVDFENIYVFDLRHQNWQEPILKLSTLEMLPEQAILIKEKKIFGLSLIKYISYWLDYLAHPYYGKKVPGVRELESVGLMMYILGARIRDLDLEDSSRPCELKLNEELNMYIPQVPFYEEYDILVQRPTGELVMIVDFRLSDWLNYADSLEKLTPTQAKQLVPYAMVVDYENIFVFDLRRQNWQEPILKLLTLDMLPEQATLIKEKNIFGWSLIKYISYWLDYLAHPNYGKIVPGVTELESVGVMTHILDARIRDLDLEDSFCSCI
ncbi:hypothetical protein CAL7716_094520 [Calothrix sp. PCC 7716]|nr:hypothetical protein CAL7716_094520 [Calothrix sp. PCC 7716]